MQLNSITYGNHLLGSNHQLNGSFGISIRKNECEGQREVKKSQVSTGRPHGGFLSQLTAMLLSEKELTAFAKLKQVKGEDIWSIAIRQVMNDFTVDKYRLLICSLLSQNDDDPECMKRILGDAYESVISL